MSEVTIAPKKGLTFEDVWAMFQETAQRLQESGAEFDRRLQESREEFNQRLQESGAEFDRRLQERSAETERLLKESLRKSERDFNKKFGYLENRFGELAEHLVVPNIVEKFNALGYHFIDVSKERKFYRKDGTIAAEFDILLENGESIVGVEVKSKPVDRDIEKHIERLEFLRRCRDELGDKREIRGAIAGAIMPENIRIATLHAGLYVIEQSGDTVRIEKPKNVRGW